MIIAYCMRVTTVPVVLPFEWVSFPPPPPSHERDKYNEERDENNVKGGLCALYQNAERSTHSHNRSINLAIMNMEAMSDDNSVREFRTRKKKSECRPYARPFCWRF